MDIEAAVDAVASAGMSEAKQREGLQTVWTLLSNVAKSPDQAKFREVKKTNPKIQSRLFPQCFDLMRAAGFEDSGELLVYRIDPGTQLHEALNVVESLLLSLGQDPSATPSSSSSAPAKPKVHCQEAASQKGMNPAQTKRAMEQQRAERAKAEQQQSKASAQDQLAALRRGQANKYQEQQDVALAWHLSGRNAEEPYDPISALNASRGATYSFASCTRCGSSLRYNSATRAQAVLCPCGMLLQPIHLRGQSFDPRSPSDLPVEPGEPVHHDNQPRSTRGPFITVRGPDGTPTRLPLHSVLQMVRQHEQRQTAGAQDETIEALPTRKYGASEGGAAGEDSNCQICMEDFEEDDELRTLPCFHLFHAHCVDQWLKEKALCPTCRHKIE